ncbi:hypothetical protein AMR74_13370 [Halorubrum tropicale]|uniref:Uncharacterized protein n=1 Tax=Halorubrum tropicale TaxID=1765655 RepID=A0A0M9AQX4_9EURY|nr:hypothetical protein AMR74_13370 [Halorubrum tropicale]
MMLAWADLRSEQNDISITLRLLQTVLLKHGVCLIFLMIPKNVHTYRKNFQTFVSGLMSGYTNT